MIQFPPVKINLGLQVVSKRPDGFHDLHSVFYPLPLHDILEIVTDESGTDVSLTLSGETVPGDPAQNTCVRAWHMLKADFPSLPAVKIHLHKSVPAGAGLGAGSADGAFALRMLNVLGNLDLNIQQLHQYAAKLGSDCPFFLYDNPCEVHGRGEIIEPLDYSLDQFTIRIVHPGIHVSTKEAFAGISPSGKETDLLPLLGQMPDTWNGQLINDFEKTIFPLYPEIAALKQSLYDAGALYASMSGSGSAVFGLFASAPSTATVYPPHYFIRDFPPANRV